MKKKLAALLLAAPACAFSANGPADGIYTCTASMGGRVASAYLTVNGHLDGSTIWAVAAISPSQTFYGYGMGVVSGGAFAGTTSHGGSFALVVTPISMHGTVGIYQAGSFYNASVNCIKVW